MKAKRLFRTLVLVALTLCGVVSSVPSAQGSLTVANFSTSTDEDTTKRIPFSALLGTSNANVLGGVAPYTITSVSGANNGTVSIDTGTSEVVFVPTSNFSGTATFTFFVQDSTTSPTFLTGSATATVTVNPISDVPTLTVQNATGDEDTAIPLNITITPVDTDFSETISVVISSIPTGATLDNTSHDVPTVSSGSVTLSQSRLSGLSIKPPTNSKASIALSVVGKSTDKAGTVTAADASTAAQTLTVTVNPVSDLPTLTVLNASGNEDTEISLSITITAGDSSETLSVTISNIPNGATLLDGTSPITISNNSATLTSSQLSALKIKPATNSDTDFTLSVQASSKDGTAIPASTQSINLNVQVNPVNDAPSFTKGIDIVVDEDAGQQFYSNWATAISPGGNEFGQVLTFQVTVPTASASLFSVAPSITPEGHLTFTTAPDANSTAVTVTVTLKDNGGTANGGADTSASQTFTITVNAINDAPHVTAPFQQAVKEDTTLTFSTSNNNLISVSDVDAGSDTQLSLSVQNGKISLSTITGLSFLDASGGTSGTLTVNNSANIVVKGALSALRTALGGMTYTPNTEFNGTDTLVILANDLASAAAGGNLIDTKTVNINVIPVNDQPVITNPTPTFNVDENSPPGFFIGKVDATDADPGTSLNFVITSGNLGGVFNINSGSGEIFVAGKLDYEPLPTDKKYTLSVLAADNGNPALSATATVTINVRDVNEPPFIRQNQIFAVDENANNGTVVSQQIPGGSPVDHVIASDPDAGSAGTLSYSIVSGNDEGRFTIDATTGQIKVVNNTTVGPLDFETRQVYNLIVKATDGGTSPLSDTANIVVNVRDINEPPVVQNQTFSVDENSLNGTFVGNVLATDPDNGARLNYTILSGDEGKFGIDLLSGHIVVKGLLDFETKNSYNLSVKVTDNGGSPATASVTVNINNLNELPIVNVPPSPPLTIDEDTPLTFSTSSTSPVTSLTISDDSGNELIDLTLKADHGTLKINNAVITDATVTAQSGADNTGRMRIRGKVVDLNRALNGLVYTPELNYSGPDFLDVLVDDRGFTGAGGPLSTLAGVPLRVRPVIDGSPSITSTTTPFQILSDEGLMIQHNPADGQEVTHFKITEITGGRLFQRDGRTEIVNGNFITAFEAHDGLRFLPNSINPGSFKAQASLSDNPNGSGLGGTPATASITVVKADQFLNFQPIQSSKKFGDPPFSANATASSGLPVQFQVNGPAAIVTHVVTLNGASERPNPVTTSATGSGAASLNGSQLIFTINYSGLSGVANGAHIHGPAGVEQIATVMIDLGSFAIGGFKSGGVIAGSVSLTADQATAISAGQAYVNIHTDANPNGEIRGQLVAPSITNGKLLMITGAGIANVTATQPGDSQYNPAPSVGQFVTIFKANQTLNLSPIGGKNYGDPSFNAPASSSSGLPVRVEVNSGPAVLGTDGKIQILGAGFVTLVATQDGNENFHPAQPALQSFNVARAPLNINVNTASRSFGQPNPTFTGTFTGLRNNDSITINYGTSANQNSPPGSYDIFPTFLDPSGKLSNYSLNITRGTLTITANAAPVATGQTVSTDEDTPKTITLSGTDAEGATLDFMIGQVPQHGTLTGTPPNMTYTPAANFNGPDSFTFRVHDDFQDSSPATVAITVNAINDPPTLAQLPNIGLRPDGPVITIPLFGLSPGPQDEQAQTLTVAATSSDTAKVTVQGVDQRTASQNAAVRIQPAAGLTSGSATITITVNDNGTPTGTTQRSFTATITPRILRLVNTTGLAGSQVSVPVELVAQGDENTFGFSVDFDETKVSFANVVFGADTSASSVGATLQINAHDAAQGQVGFALALPAGQVFAAGTKQVALLNFNVPVDAQEATTRVNFTPFPIFPEVVNAQAARLTVAVDGADLNIALGFEADVTPAPNGNNDGHVTVTDFTKVGLFAIHLESPSSMSEFRRADCAPLASLGDGTISLPDWTQAGRYAAGLDLVSGQVPKAGGPSASTQTGTQSLGSGESSVALKSTAGATRSVRLHDRKIQRGQNFIVLASVEARGDENTLGFSLSYNPKSVQFVKARLVGEAQAATLLTNDREAEEGRVGLAFAMPAGRALSSGSGAVIELEFAASPSTAESVSLIQLADTPVRREVVSVTASEIRANYSDAAITFQEATEPASPNQPMRNLSVADRAPAGEVVLRLTGAPGSQLMIETSTDLTRWTPLKTVTVTNGDFEFVDSDAKNLPGRFYRVRPVR